jgi:large subunit ribosomal protein L15
MKLNELADRPGARKKRMRVGRGIGSGMGKTGGRGGKGQTARSGVRIKGFEGGQMPLHRRLPKRGFNNLSTRDYNEVGLERIQQAIDSGRLDKGATVNAAALKAAGIIRRSRDGVRILANGALKAKLAFEVEGASAGARAAIEKAGGKVTIVGVAAAKAAKAAEAAQAKTAE